MLSGYAPILFFFGICAAFAVFAQLLNAVLGPKRPTPTKDLPYESGMVPRESAPRVQSSVNEPRVRGVPTAPPTAVGPAVPA